MYFGFGSNVIKSFIDNFIRDNVKPVFGSILYCELAFGIANHSGIYIGNNEIIQLDGSGAIEIVSPENFLDRLGGLNSALSIYVSSKGKKAVGNKDVAKRAKDMANTHIKYSLVFNNCHKFTSGCLTGNFENTNTFLDEVKQLSSEYLQSDTWRVWDRQIG